MKYVVIIICALVLLMPISTTPSPNPGPSPTPQPGPNPNKDMPTEVFADYLRRWREVQADTATKLEDGELSNAQDSRAYRSAENVKARVAAMRRIAGHEESILGGEKYSTSTEAKMLRGYAAE